MKKKINTKSKKISNVQSNAQRLLEACKNNIGEWTCIYCNTGSGQPAAVSRTLRQEGYKFEEASSGIYSKQLYCPHCEKKRTHIKLLAAEPVNDKKKRCPMSNKDRNRVIAVCGGERDAYTGASIQSTRPEVDHKTPFLRLKEDIDVSKLTDEQIKCHFQILTSHNNLLKEKACKRCAIYNMRPPFMNIKYWYSGDEIYRGTCVGCGWYDGIKWKEELNNLIKNKSSEQK